MTGTLHEDIYDNMSVISSKNE